jgi:hypothetical protein
MRHDYFTHRRAVQVESRLAINQATFMCTRIKNADDTWNMTKAVVLQTDACAVDMYAEPLMQQNATQSIHHKALVRGRPLKRKD